MRLHACWACRAVSFWPAAAASPGRATLPARRPASEAPIIAAVGRDLPWRMPAAAGPAAPAARGRCRRWRGSRTAGRSFSNGDGSRWWSSWRSADAGSAARSGCRGWSASCACSRMKRRRGRRKQPCGSWPSFFEVFEPDPRAHGARRGASDISAPFLRATVQAPRIFCRLRHRRLSLVYGGNWSCRRLPRKFRGAFEATYPPCGPGRCSE